MSEICIENRILYTKEVLDTIFHASKSLAFVIEIEQTFYYTFEFN